MSTDPTPSRRASRHDRRRAHTARLIGAAYAEGRQAAADHIRALEARLEELDADLQAATHFLVGPCRIARRRDQWEVWPDPARISLHTPGAYDPVPCPTRDEALALARRLAATRDEAHALAVLERRDSEVARLWLAWQSARRRARQQHDALREALAADRGQVRRTRDRYRGERDTARRENADLRAQLAATTNPDRAEAPTPANDTARLLGTADLYNRIQRAIRAHADSDLDLSRWTAEDVMDIVTPALAARDARIAELKEQLAATTRPHRAEDRLAADAHPGTERSGR